MLLMDDNEKQIEVILYETRETYSRNLKNSDKLDLKLDRLITFTTAILLLFIEYVEIPEKNILKFLYIITSAILLVILIRFIIAYNPLSYKSIDPNPLINKYVKKKYRSRKDLLGAIAGTTGDNVNSVKENNTNKAKILRFYSIIYILIFLSIVILKYFE